MLEYRHDDGESAKGSNSGPECAGDISDVIPLLSPISQEPGHVRVEPVER